MAKPRKPKKLTPRQRARRRRRAQNRTLYNPQHVLAGESLRAALENLVEGETAPRLREIDTAIAGNRSQGAELGRRAGGYYQQLATQAQGVLDTQGAIGARLNKELRGIDQEAGGRIAGAHTQAQGAQAQDAATRGQGLEGGAAEALAREFAAQQSGQARTGQAFRSAGALQGANYQGLAAGTKAATALRGGELQGEIIGRTQSAERDLQGKRAGVIEDRGALRTKLLLQLRSAGFEQLATQLGLGIKQQGQALDAQQDASQNALDADRIAATVRGQDLASQDRNRGLDIKEQGGGGGQGHDYGSGRTREQRLASRGKFNKELAALRNDTWNDGPKLTRLLRRNPRKWGPILVRDLTEKLGDEDLALAAVRIARGKPVGAALVRKIRRTYGFTPKGKKAKKKRKPKKENIGVW